MNNDSSLDKNHSGTWIGWIGAIGFIIGLVIGFTEVGRCGSPFARDSFAARLYDSMAGTNTAARCAEELASGTMFAWAFTILGVIMIILGVVLHVVLNRAPARHLAVQSHSPSVSERLQKLEELKTQDLLTETEYHSKRQKLLEEL